VGVWELSLGSHCPTILLYGIIFVKMSIGSLEEGKMRFNRTGACLVIIGVYMIMRLVAPMIKPGRFSSIEVFLAIAVLMLVQLSLVVSIAGLRLRVRSTALLCLASGILFVGALILVREIRHISPWAVQSLEAFQDLLLMMTAGFLGCLAGLIIREPNIVLPIAMFAGLVDYWNVSLGPLGHIVEEKPSLISAVTVHMPTPMPGVPMVMIGMGDFVFLALFFSVLFRLGMNVKGSFWLGYVFLTISMWVVIFFQSAFPALLPMGVAVIGANRRHFKLKRDEQLAMVYVGAILLAFLVMSGLFWFRR